MSRRKKTAPADAGAELVVELQDELPSLDGLTGAFSCAEECSTLEDMRANLEDAIDAADALMCELRELLARAKVTP